MKELTKIMVKSGKDSSLRRFHPWVFSGAIKKIYGPVSEGDLVDVVDNKNEFLGRGYYGTGSIAIRIVSFEPIEINTDYWRQKISSALEYRKAMGILNNPDTNVYRLFHAEGDGIPGLIVDNYNGTLVMQSHSPAIYQMRHIYAEIFSELKDIQVNAIYDKSANTVHLPNNESVENEFLFGEAKNNEVLEHGHKFLIDWEKGQKTGFFVDQRENRNLVKKYAKGRKVLNMFGYTGGFSVYAASGGAELTHTVDCSKPAIEQTEKNIEANFGSSAPHEGFAADAFDFMKDIKDKYDLIILDPPAFAKSQRVLHNALQGYKRLNQTALEQIAPNSLMFTFSCSQAVSKEHFRKSVFAAAANAKRKVRIIEQLSQPVDHPINMYHPESEYLKGLLLYVE